MAKTTLKSLGLNRGRAMLRLIHRDPEQPKTQAHVSAPLAARPTQESIELAARMAMPNRQAAASRGEMKKTVDPILLLKSEKGQKRDTPAAESGGNEPKKVLNSEPDLKAKKIPDLAKEEDVEMPVETLENNSDEMKIEIVRIVEY